MDNKNTKFIGVDVGGTKMLLQTFDARWKLIEEEKVLTEVKKGQKGFLLQLISLIQRHFHKDIQSIGLALPGIVDQKKGVLIQAPHLPVKNLSLKRLLEAKFSCKIALENDVNAFLLAQSQDSKFKKYKNLVAVMVGTGVGGAILVEGKLLTGQKGFAGEVGHMVLCQDHVLDTFEKNVGGFFIPQLAKSLGIKTKFTPSQLLTSSPEAKKVRAHLIQYLGLGLTNLSLIFNPDAFILGGSIYNYYLKRYKKELRSIISGHTLDKKAPLILEAKRNSTAAMGAAIRSQS